MVLCLIALPLFAVLGVFSVRYRKLFLESLDCLCKKATFRPCKSGLDDRIKSKVSGSLLRYSPSLAKVFYKHYNIVALLFTGLLLWSLVVSGIGIYNYSYYGNCNGPDSDGFCMLDPSGANSRTSKLDLDVPDELIMPSLERDDPVLGDPSAPFTIIQFGCYACPYTKKAEPVVHEILSYYDGLVNIQFKTFIIPHHDFAVEAAVAANCAGRQGKYLGYHDILFEHQLNWSSDSFVDFAVELDLDVDAFSSCLNDSSVLAEVQADSLAGINAGVIGTPTFFIGEQRVVGPKPFKTFKRLINKELKRNGIER